MNNIQNNVDVAKGRVARKNSVPLMWRVLSKAKKIYDVQVGKSNEVKLNCLNRFMFAEYNDEVNFWKEYAWHVNRLLDSRKFCKSCVLRGLEPQIVAEHIVYQGSSAVHKVLEDGLEKYIGGGIDEYRNRFTPNVINQFIDTFDVVPIPRVEEQID